MSTYTPIATRILNSTATSVTFNGIPQNYTDLVLIANFGTSANDYVQIVLNSDTTVSNYSGTYILGGSSAATGRYTGANGAYWLGGSTQTSTTTGQSIGRYMFLNYSNTTTYKNAIQRADTGSTGVGAMIGTWRNTDAINSITFQIVNGQTINSGSTFSLYGIASGSAKATGGIVTTDGTYFYHTFTSSGIFTPTQALTVDYLVVAGGGGGGSGLGGGGGAGGMRCTVGATGGGGNLETPLSLLAQDYTVQIGAGGKAVWTNQGLQGSNSVFATITSTGGGGGSSGSVGAFTTGAGGSGGGGGNGFSAGARTASPVQGNNGGPDGGAAGGGGAGAVGGAGAGPSGGNGGNGQATSISGSSVTYAGGGGGSQDRYGGAAQGSGGTGGGGAGAAGSAAGTVATAGTANTGGGGGGGGNNNGRGNTGGSGIVIVRYAV